MSFVVLPINSNPDALTFVELGGETFGFRTRFNSRDAAWFLDILDSEGDPLAQSLRIGNRTILNKFVSSLEGTLFALSMDDQNLADPGELDLGERVLLMYEDV